MKRFTTRSFNWLLHANVGATVGRDVHDAVREAFIAAGLTSREFECWESPHPRFMGGQFSVGYMSAGSPAFLSFLRDVCGLELDEEMERRALAYQQTVESACWWWPHRDFVIACRQWPTILVRNGYRNYTLSSPAIAESLTAGRSLCLATLSSSFTPSSPAPAAARAPRGSSKSGKRSRPRGLELVEVTAAGQALGPTR